MAELVGLQGQPVDLLPKLSQILQIRAQKAAAESAEQSQRQRAGIASYDWNKHLGPDGTLDVESFANDETAPHIFGDQYIDYLSKVSAAKQQQLVQKETLFKLRTEQREAFAAMTNAMRSDPDVAQDNEKGRQKVNDAFIQYQKVYGTRDTLPVLEAYGPSLQKAPQGRLSDALKAIGLQAFDVQNQVNAQNPQFVSKGGSLTNINPNVAGNPQDIPLTLPPGAQAIQGVDQLGNPYITYRDARGNIIGTSAMGGGDNGPARFGPGERATFEAQAEKNFENVTANRQAASMAPQQLDQIDKALDLSRQVSTGAWATHRASLESGIGSLIPGYEGMDDASKLQELDKFAERIATDASKVLGVNAKTDAERESIHKQNANIGYTPQAIQAVLKYAKAQTLAMQAKGDAQEAWLSKGNKITNQHDFETAFRKAYDPRVFQFETMSPAEQDAFTRTLSKEDRKTLREKTQALIELGAIPGD